MRNHQIYYMIILLFSCHIWRIIINLKPIFEVSTFTVMYLHASNLQMKNVAS